MGHNGYFKNYYYCCCDFYLLLCEQRRPNLELIWNETETESIKSSESRI